MEEMLLWRNKMKMMNWRMLAWKQSYAEYKIRKVRRVPINMKGGKALRQSIIMNVSGSFLFVCPRWGWGRMGIRRVGEIWHIQPSLANLFVHPRWGQGRGDMTISAGFQRSVVCAIKLVKNNEQIIKVSSKDITDSLTINMKTSE